MGDELVKLRTGQKDLLPTKRNIATVTRREPQRSTGHVRDAAATPLEEETGRLSETSPL